MHYKVDTEEAKPSVRFLQHAAKLDKPTNRTSQLPFNPNHEPLMIYSIICQEVGCRIIQLLFTLYILRYKLHEITLIIQIQTQKGDFSSKILLAVVGSKSFRLDEPFIQQQQIIQWSSYASLPFMSCQVNVQYKDQNPFLSAT